MHCSVIEHSMTSLNLQTAIQKNEAKLKKGESLGLALNQTKGRENKVFWQNQNVYQLKNLVDLSQFTPDKIDSFANCNSEGYLLEVDVRYPKELHDYHNDLPFMCEKMKISRVKKLVPNLYDKRNYVINIRALSQALKHGLILEKVHRVIEFNQGA